jgi:hypothetical protein
VIGTPYPRENEILHRAHHDRADQADLYTPDLIFTNAIRAAAILKNGDREEFKRLKEHIRRGVYDVSTDDMPMLQPGEKRLYKYVAGGDAMLLDYCNLLNEEVSMTLHFLSNYF